MKSPKDLPKPPVNKDGKRALAVEGDTTKFPVGTVHVVLPFRVKHLNKLPSLLKSLGKVKEYNPALSFHVIIAPMLLPDFTPAIQAKLEAIAAAASPVLKFPITVSVSVTADDQAKTKLSPLLKGWIDASSVPDFSSISSPAPATLLPSPYLGALLGAMKAIPRVRAPMLVLDSATYAVPSDLVKKTLWRIINGRMIYSPVPHTFESADVSGMLLGSGNAEKSAEELAAGNLQAKYTSAEFWRDIGGIEDDEAGVGSRIRRSLRAVSATLSRSLRLNRLLSKVSVSKYFSYYEASSSSEEESDYSDYSATEYYADDDYARRLQAKPKRPTLTGARKLMAEGDANAEADAAAEAGGDDDNVDDDDVGTPYGGDGAFPWSHTAAWGVIRAMPFFLVSCLVSCR